MATGGNISKATNVSGATYNLFAVQPLKQLTIFNDTGTAIEWRQDATGVALPVADGASFTIFGIYNASQIGIRRLDQSNTPVTLKARWES